MGRRRGDVKRKIGRKAALDGLIHPWLTHLPLALSIATPALLIWRCLQPSRGGIGERRMSALLGIAGCAAIYVAMASGDYDARRLFGLEFPAAIESHRDAAQCSLLAWIGFSVAGVILLRKLRDRQWPRYLLLGLALLASGLTWRSAYHGIAAIYRAGVLPDRINETRDPSDRPAPVRGP